MLKTTASKISFLSEINSQDMNYLHGQIKKLQKLLLNEQDKFTKLQKRLQDSEGQRFLSMSETNREIFNLNAQVTKIRSELEKSEALRQALEYELTMNKSSVQKERTICYEKEKMLEDINKNLEGIN
jgi:predicted  nucleic acid-binding Zn-ribbon protein